MKILVIDSDRDWVEMLTSWLKKLGYEAYYQYTGELAKIEWKKQQPDLVILDTNLRDVDALNLCREMRGKHNALVLVTTTYVSLTRPLNFRRILILQWLEEDVLILQRFLLRSSRSAPSVSKHHF